MTKNGNILEVVKTQTALIEEWPFYLEGLVSMNDPRRANMRETPDVFLKMMSRIVACSKTDDGCLVVVRSKNGKPLGFGAAFNATGDFSRIKILFIYAVYSNGKNAKTVSDLMEWCEGFAKEHEYNALQAVTGRFSGAAFRWFEGKFGFRRKSLIFQKEL